MMKSNIEGSSYFSYKQFKVIKLLFYICFHPIGLMQGNGEISWYFIFVDLYFMRNDDNYHAILILFLHFIC
uniref:Uncharacterized protein n=1 Tax=Rhizophora mucronata TaxID=61149 RepID=A0A2P2IPT3_RHIMU